MIRRRVDVLGRVREMEEKESIPALKLTAKEIGLLKQRPAERWLKGQEIWDQRFRKRAIKIMHQRQKNKIKYEEILGRAREMGLVHDTRKNQTVPLTRPPTQMETQGEIQNDRRWGPLDLDDEDPPSSAIAARRDTVSLPSRWELAKPPSYTHFD